MANSTVTADLPRRILPPVAHALPASQRCIGLLNGEASYPAKGCASDITGHYMAYLEYHPVFRPFFENAALAIIAIVALGELGRLWGVDVRGDGNPWTAFLNIVLASVLCWLCYRALNIFIDKRIAEEGGAPEPEELGAEGGGAGASRVATLLPIAR